jgi:hypothetical protein
MPYCPLFALAKLPRDLETVPALLEEILPAFLIVPEREQP